MNKKNLLIVTSIVVFVGLLGAVYFSGMLNSVKTTPATASLDGNFDASGANIQSIYGSLNTAVSNNSGWQAEMRNNNIALVDSKSGKEFATLTKVSDNQISITSVVASLGALPAEQKENIKRQISEFNDHSGVGTMMLQANGDVTMEHKVNPMQSTPDQIAKVAVTFGEKTREQAQKYGVMKLAANS